MRGVGSLQAKENKGGKAEKKQDAGAPALGQATRIGARDWVHEEAGRDTKRDDDRAYYEQEVRCWKSHAASKCRLPC